MPDYTFDFGNISDRWIKTPVKVSSNTRKTHVHGTIRVSIDDNPILASSLNRMPELGADLLDLAVATFVADRRSQRIPNPDGELDAHEISVHLPLRNSNHFQQFQPSWTQLLHYYIQDNWLFDFTERSGIERSSSMQSTLWQPIENVEVALFSGGLDSMAGLVNRIAHSPQKKYILVGGGAHQGAFETQRNLKTALQRQFPNTSLSLVQIQLHQSGVKPFHADPDFRSRGLVFTLFGAACAIAHGQQTLHIYENAIGAYNFPPRRSSVGLDHSLAVHPYSLLRVSDFISSILGISFIVVNPFEASTKAQMCAMLTNYDLLDAVALTVSCDKASYGHPQCGSCSSCVLRRQSLQAAGIEDRTAYVTSSLDVEKRDRVLRRSHLPAMLYCVRKLEAIFNTEDSWRAFKLEHPSRGWDAVAQIAKRTGKTEVEVAIPMLRAHQLYLDEWKAIEGNFANELDAIRDAKRAEIAKKKAIRVGL